MEYCREWNSTPGGTPHQVPRGGPLHAHEGGGTVAPPCRLQSDGFQDVTSRKKTVLSSWGALLYIFVYLNIFYILKYLSICIYSCFLFEISKFILKYFFKMFMAVPPPSGLALRKRAALPRSGRRRTAWS